ncbi:hypothetical protein JG688_00010355 [Phytophthora aleatoria]|uniref:Uncharacterized protein n=1 Tax=Phytophthora aleatoria TaxID=2496075 RepID=A0A8J5IQE6_9STRA|nr:hypothetical protein JG688_00010355 [Phytophthora aleatoria]
MGVRDVRRALSAPEVIDLPTPSAESIGDASPGDEGGPHRPQMMKQKESDTESRSAGSEPPRFDDTTAEPLSFTEMLEYLRIEMKGTTLLEQAVEVESAKELTQELFEEVFTARPAKPLPPERSYYPALQVGELSQLIQPVLGRNPGRQSECSQETTRLHYLTRPIYKSRKCLLETLEISVQAEQAQPK